MWRVTKGLREEKCIRPNNYTSAVVKISFFSPKNVGFFISKLGRARTEQLIDCGLSCGIVFPFFGTCFARIPPIFNSRAVRMKYSLTSNCFHAYSCDYGDQCQYLNLLRIQRIFNFSLIESCSRSNSTAFHCVSFSSKTESEVSSTSLLTSYTSVYVSSNNFVQFLLGACSTTVLQYPM